METPASRAGRFELSSDYNWILKGWGGCHYVAPGLLVLCTRRPQFVPMVSSACGCREQSVLFLPVISRPGDISSDE